MQGGPVVPGAALRLNMGVALSPTANQTVERAKAIHRWLLLKQISPQRVPELWSALEPFLGGFEFDGVDQQSLELTLRKGDVPCGSTSCLAANAR